MYEIDYSCDVCDEQIIHTADGWETTADGADCEVTDNGHHRPVAAVLLTV